MSSAARKRLSIEELRAIAAPAAEKYSVDKAFLFGSAAGWDYGEESGLTAIQKENAVEAANRTVDVNERENRTREEIRRGSALSKVNGLAKWDL